MAFMLHSWVVFLLPFSSHQGITKALLSRLHCVALIVTVFAACDTSLPWGKQGLEIDS
jgi:hypothetical protein